MTEANNMLKEPYPNTPRFCSWF